MTEKKDIITLLEKIISKKKYRDVNREALRDVFLRAELRQPRFDAGNELLKIKSRIHAAEKGKNRGFGRHAVVYRAFAGIAACVVIAVALAVFQSRGKDAVTGAPVCSFVYGDVRLECDGGAAFLTAGGTLQNDDVIVTGARSCADITYREEIRIRIKEKSRLHVASLMRSDGGALKCDVELSRGSALLNFKKIGRGDSATIKTPTSVAGVRGTSFGVAVADDLSVRYEVLEGKIVVKNRIAVSPDIRADDATKLTVSRIEKAIKEKERIVGPGNVCHIDAGQHRRLQESVDSLIKKAETHGADSISEKSLQQIAASVPEIREKTAGAHSMAYELRGFAAATAPGAGGKITASVTASPDTAEIVIDGVSTGKGSVTFESIRESHVLEISAPGYETKQIRMLPRKNPALTVTLARKVDEAFNFNAWASSMQSSYIITDSAAQSIISVSPHGVIDSVTHGARLWSYECGSAVNSYPVMDADRMYIATADERLIAVSLKNGRALWSKHIEGVLYPGTRPALCGDSLYVVTAKGCLFCYDRKGILRWRISLPGDAYSSPVIRDTLVFVPVQDGYVYGIDVNLRLIVLKIKTGRIVGSTIAVRNSRLYSASLGGEIMCYNYRGDEIEWRYAAKGAVITDILLNEENMYITTVGGDIIKISLENGRQIWRIATGDAIDRNPVLDRDGIYVLSRQVFYLVDTESGIVKWSFVIPSEATSNIALADKNVIFGTEKKGIVSLNK